MATTAELITAKEDLESLLNSGATTITVDGVVTSFDHESARKRIREIDEQIRRKQNKRPSRPIARTINMKGLY